MQLQVSIKFFKIYLGSPILGRVTATARGANKYYGQPITVPPSWEDCPLLLMNSGWVLKHPTEFTCARVVRGGLWFTWKLNHLQMRRLYKSSTFSSVILRSLVLVRLGFEPLPSNAAQQIGTYPIIKLTRWQFMHNIKCTKWNVKWLSNLLIKYKWNDSQAEAISAWKNSFSIVFSNSCKPHDQRNFFCWIKFCPLSLKTFEWHVLQIMNNDLILSPVIIISTYHSNNNNNIVII